MYQSDSAGNNVPLSKVYHSEPMRTPTGEIRSSGRLMSSRFKKRLEAEKRSKN